MLARGEGLKLAFNFPDIPDCHIRLSDFLEKIRSLSKFYRNNIRCSRENRIMCMTFTRLVRGGRTLLMTSRHEMTSLAYELTSHYDGTLTITLFVLGHFDFRTWQFYVISTFGPFEPLLFRYFTNCNFDVWTFHQYSFRHLDFSY